MTIPRSNSSGHDYNPINRGSFMREKKHLPWEIKYLKTKSIMNIQKAFIIFYDYSFLPVIKTFSSIKEENLKNKIWKIIKTKKKHISASIISVNILPPSIVNTCHIIIL